MSGFDAVLILQLLATLLGGTVLLTLGAEGVVRGGSRLAALFGIPPLIIGLTIVSAGTSAPELAVSLDAALRGEVGITMGNIIGSNIANTLLILGVCATIAPLPINRSVITFDAPFLITVSVITALIALDGRLSVGDGTLLLVLLAGYTWYLFRRARARGGELVGLDIDLESIDEPGDGGARSRALLTSIAYLVIGGVMLPIGAEIFVSGATKIATLLGVSQLVIGLTVVAIGTSLPEVATSVLASVRGELDIAVGNVVGSCILNTLLVLGTSSVIHPIDLQPVVTFFDIPVMVGVMIVCQPIFLAYMTISRGEGIGMFCGYLFYLTLVILRAGGSELFDTFVRAFGYAVLPVLVCYLAWRVYVSRDIWRGSCRTP